MSRYTHRGWKKGLGEGFWVDDGYGFKIFISWKDDVYNAIAKLADLEDLEAEAKLAELKEGGGDD